jgi:hypothetical protein
LCRRALLTVFQYAPERKSEDNDIIKAPERTENVRDEIEREHKVYDRKDERRFM